MNRNLIGIFLILPAISCFCIPGSLLAIPTLGVAPGEPGSGGVYYGPTPSYSSYQWVFADSFVGGSDGFAMPSSGGQLSVWYGSNNGNVNRDNNLWLVTTSAAGATFTFGNQEFGLNNNLAAAGYKEDVYGLKLGTINDPLIGTWESLAIGDFGSGKKEFFVLTAPIDYSGFLAGDWMYAVVANSPVSDFSPRTTAATNAVPESSAMLLLGGGLLGLAAFGRKRLKK